MHQPARDADRSPRPHLPPVEALTAKLQAHVAKNPGQHIEQIGAGLGGTTKKLASPAKKLIARKVFAVEEVLEDARRPAHRTCNPHYRSGL
jgi:hypothetical protein